MEEYKQLKLESQLCFPLYACAKETVRKYKPFLDKIDLTYTQYITMLVLWETKNINVKELGERLYLDSGTLTPLLKILEIKGYINRNRDKQDERNLIISITEKGMKLREEAKDIPYELAKFVCLDKDECYQLYKLLYKLISGK